MCEGRHLAVAGNEGSLASHRPQPLGDRIKQILVIAAGEVGASDRSLEQHIANQRELRFGMVEDNVPGGVPGAVAHAECQFSDRHRIAIDQPAVGHEWLPGDAVAGAILRQPVDPEQIVLVRPFDRQAKLAIVGDVLFRGSIGRTDFPMGNHQDLLDAITTKLWPLGGDTAFVPGHGPMSNFAEERRSNPFVADRVLARA